MVDIVTNNCAAPDELTVGYCDVFFVGFVADEYFDKEDGKEEEIQPPLVIR